MAQDTLFTLKNPRQRSKSKGIAAVVTLFLAAVLALISYKIIEIGAIAINVNTEKQLLDTCGIIVGQNIIKTNNIEEACSQEKLNQCINFIENSTSRMECIDLGLECDVDNNCEQFLTRC